nr:hypothetical protein PPOKNCAL_00733 [Escherichia coli]
MNNSTLTAQSFDSPINHLRKPVQFFSGHTCNLKDIDCDMQITPYPYNVLIYILQSILYIPQSIFITRGLVNGMILRHKCVCALYKRAVIPLPRHMLTSFACLLRRAVS